MKSIAGAIVVLAGAMIIGLAVKQIPYESLPTSTSLGLMLIGLIVIFIDRGTCTAHKENNLNPKS